MPRRLLVVVTTDVPDATLSELVLRRAGEDAEVRVVAPASDISRLDWLTNAEDDARGEASSLANSAADAAPTADVKAEVGDSDPIKAIEDALREFSADGVGLFAGSGGAARVVMESCNGAGRNAGGRSPAETSGGTLPEGRRRRRHPIEGFARRRSQVLGGLSRLYR